MNIHQWDRFHCLGMLIMSAVFLAGGVLLPMILFSLLSFSFLWIRGWSAISHLRPAGGMANRVTLARFAGLILLILFRERLTRMEITSGLAVLILLDGLDGYIARKRKEKTTFGAWFDMESDALFVCLVSCVLYLDGLIGWPILIPAFLRYVNVFILWLLNLHGFREGRTRLGPAAAVTMFLVLAADFILPPDLRTILTARPRCFSWFHLPGHLCCFGEAPGYRKSGIETAGEFADFHALRSTDRAAAHFSSSSSMTPADWSDLLQAQRYPHR